jgi:hypothetical protein
VVNIANSRAALAFLSQTQNGAAPGLDAATLASWAASRRTAASDSKRTDPDAPVATVWQPGISPNSQALMQRVLDGQDFFDLNTPLFADLGATGDYRRLFALHTGLTTLNALGGAAARDDLAASERRRLDTQFARGIAEMREFLAAQQFEKMRLAQGDLVEEAKTSLALPSKSEDYQTGIIHRGSLAAVVSGLPSDAAFEIVATSAAGTERRVAIDLADMGSIPRTLGAVVSFINGELSTAGAASRLEAVDQTPKTSVIVVGGRPVTTRYTGAKQYALKVDVRAGEQVAFAPAAAQPAFYAVGQVAGGGARLIKLEDVGGAPGQPAWLTRPPATADPIGANVATGWLGPGAPYTATPAGAYEQRTNAMTSAGANSFESALRTAGEAALKLKFADGRELTLTTAWRSEDLEAWRVRSGEDGDRAILDDVAERLTQLLHEQGVAAGIEVWENGTDRGLSLLNGDFVSITGLAISGKAAALTPTDPAGMVGGLRDGVFARRFEAAAVANAGDLFIGNQSFTVTMANATETMVISGGTAGISAATLVQNLNDRLRARGVPAAASLVDNAGSLSLRIDALHGVLDVSASINGVTHDTPLQPPVAGVQGGLPVASGTQPFAAGVRTMSVVGAPPLATYAGDIDLELIVATSTGQKTVSVSVSAAERALDPDPAPGEWSSAFQARLDEALNAAGVYVDAEGADLANWSASEAAGHRIVSLSINGNALTLEGAAPALGIGGAFSVERSFTSAQAAAGTADDVADLIADPNISISFDTIWGARTINAVLDPLDPATLESAALRLNNALGAAGYDLGAQAVALSGGGAGLRIVTGASRSVSGVSSLTLGAGSAAVTLDPIDSVSRADDPVGAAGVAVRASRGASVLALTPALSPFAAPSANATAWFPGRAFDVALAGASAATARAVATGADGAVYVLADLEGDSAAGAIKGARDVALMKYDSAGKLAFTHILGASQSARGFALAVSADGKVAVAGSVEGEISNAGASAGKTDSFVSLFDANGGELWTARRGASAHDEAQAVAFAANGAIIVSGRTESALGAAIALGSGDGYVRGLSASGADLFMRQFGTAGDDGASALVVRDAGAGVTEIFTAGVEDARGVVRRFTYSSAAGLAAGAARDIGYFQAGALNAIAADGASLYVGGEVGADRLSLSATARGAVAGSEGFVARLDADLTSTALDRATYLGSAQGDSVKSLAIVGGEIYAAGGAGGAVAGQGAAKTPSAFLARLDSAGETAWVRSFRSAGGQFALAGLAVDSGGASPLDVLGLPRGAIAAASTATMTTRSALRVGDEFQIGAEGKRLTTIKIDASDTLGGLVASINRAIGAAGRAEIVKENGVERLKLSARDGRALRLEAGREGRDGLGALGLTPGLVARNLDGAGMKSFGLGLLDGDLKLDSKPNIARAKAELSAAISIVRQAYDALLHPNAKALTPEEQALEQRRQNAGLPSELYSAQIANYRAALARLGG